MPLIGSIGEHAAIHRLMEYLSGHPALSGGLGDDCAVCPSAHLDWDQVLTSDATIEGVHFETGEVPRRIGNKAAGRVLSDIAAMGAAPQWVVVNAVVAATLPMECLEGIYEGMAVACHRFGAVIVGGDLTEGKSLEMHLFATGMLPHGTACLRSGARPGDVIMVTGPLGGSRAGKHLDFIPRVYEGGFLRETGQVSAMMDISDGLATDMRHMLEQSGVGAVLGQRQLEAVGGPESALFDGEDFELLFTVPERHAGALQSAWNSRFPEPLFTLGSMVAEPGVLMIEAEGQRQVLTGRAYMHFGNE